MTKFVLKFAIYWILIFSGMIGSEISAKWLSENPLPIKSVEEQYIPSGKGLEIFSIGYLNALSDLLWFKTINYFGKHFRSEKNYQWLKSYLKLVIQLNPKASHVYEFGATMLAWEAEDPSGAIEILNSAITEFPNDWYFYHLRGFTKLYFLHDFHGAKEDYVLAASKPNVHSAIKELADKDFSNISEKFMAIGVLRTMIATSPDPTTKVILEKKLEDIIKLHSDK